MFNMKIETAHTNELAFASVQPNEGLKKALDDKSEAIIQEITDSKLRGCGGAGFPTGLKMKFAAAEQGDNKVVVCNADEGEPGTFKDRHILTHFADLVFEGMTIVGHTIGSSKGFLYLRGEYLYLRAHLEEILENRRKQNLLGDNILNSGFNFDIAIRMGAGAYVCGEETALIESLEGRRGEPRNRPPYPIQNGYKGYPTEVNNVETYAWIATIMSKGASWFNAVGTEQSVGYKIFSISGDCAKPGVYQFPMGTTINEMLTAVGAEDAKAVQSGGASGRCIPAAEFGRKLAFEDAPPGGSIIIFGPNRDMLDVAENFMEFFVEESCGQCMPCREGNPKILEGIKALKQGKCSIEDLSHLIALGSTMNASAKCGQGQSSANAFVTIMEHFKHEFLGRSGQ